MVDSRSLSSRNLVRFSLLRMGTQRTQEKSNEFQRIVRSWIIYIEIIRRISSFSVPISRCIFPFNFNVCNCNWFLKSLVKRADRRGSEYTLRNFFFFFSHLNSYNRRLYRSNLKSVAFLSESKMESS